MKAIILPHYGASADLEYQDIPKPEITSGQVLVKVHAASVNHVDWAKASGALKHFFPLEFPWIPGGDFAGIIEEVGANVSNFQIGDHVYGNSLTGGAYAEYVAADPNVIALKPNSLSFTEAASVPIAAETAWQGLFKHGHLKSGQRVLVLAGAGAVGAYAVQFAHQTGAMVFATASGSDIDFVRSLGADKVIDYNNERFEDVTGKVDVVFDLIGGEIQKRSYTVLKEGGYLVAASQPPAAQEAEQYGVQAVFMKMEPTRDGLHHIAGLLDSGQLRTDISRVFPLNDAAVAWNVIKTNLPLQNQPGASHVRSEKAKHGKIVLEVN